MYRIVIFEESVNMRNEIKRLLQKCMEKEDSYSIDEIKFSKELLNYKFNIYDLIILNSSVIELNILEVAENIRKNNEMAVLAFSGSTFISSPKIFKVRPYRFLIKTEYANYIEEDFIDLIYEMKKIKRKEFIMVHGTCGIFKVKIEEIVYISKRKKGSNIIVTEKLQKLIGKDLYLKEHITELYNKLKEYGFEPAHDSYIINMNHIFSIQKDNILLSNNQTLKIARSRLFSFKKRIESYFNFINYFKKILKNI